MKKRIIALLLSVTLAMGSVGTVSASAAETGAQDGISAETSETGAQDEVSVETTEVTQNETASVPEEEAEEEPEQEETSDESEVKKDEAPEETEEADAGLTDEIAAEEEADAGLTGETAAEEEADAGLTGETAAVETEEAAAGLTDGTAPAEESAASGETGKPSVQVDTEATYMTNNIVGDVFARWFNTANEEEWDEIREESLEKYPLDPHDLSYYGDSLRVRYTGDEDDEGPGYFVYREEYLIFSEGESSNYTVTSSEDGTTAYVTPAIPADQLDGRIGIIFLADNIGDDNILVFGGAPQYEGIHWSCR